MNPVSLNERLLTHRRHEETVPFVPPCFADWLRFWNDDASDFENLRDLEHWLKQAQLSKQA